MSFFNNHKKAVKRGVSFIVSLVMLSELIPIPLVEDIKILGDFRLPSLTSHAANTTITNLTELQTYVNNYGSDNAYDVITLHFQNEVYIPASFPGIGTDAAPFQGTIKIDNVSNDNGGASQYINLEAPLFKAISDKASIEAVSGGPCTLYLKVTAHSSGDYITPLFAQTVYGQGGTANWSVKVNNTINRSCLIGEIKSDTAAPNVALTCTFPANNSPEINGTGDLGVICNKITNGSLALDLTNGAEASKISTTSGNVGGLVGTMASGTSLTLNSSISYNSKREIKTSYGYAGGIVGECKGTVTLPTDVTYNDSMYSTIEGTTGVGGLFGYYETSSNVEFDLSKFTVTSKQGDSADPGQGFKSAQETGKVGGIIGELKNSGSAATIIFDGNISNLTAATPNINTSLLGQYGGGLIGAYHSNTLANTLTIQNAYCQSEGSMSYDYGGLIGNVTGESDCGAYVNISNVKVLTTAHPYSGTIQWKAKNITSAGLIEEAKNSFLDINGNIIIDTVNYGNEYSGMSINAGIINTSDGGVVRLAGTTDLSSMTLSGTSGLIAVNRDNTLIYALGSGIDTGWKYIRPTAATVDDINSWGQVVRYVSTTSSDANAQNLEEASVVTVSDHTVTLSTADNSMETSSDFAKTALNIKLNTANSDFGALKFTSGNLSSTLLSSPMSLEADVDLSGSGLTGMTKDNGSNNAFTSTFNGKNNKIKLAVGEAYGYVGNVSTQAVITVGAANNATGAIQSHSHNGLFAKLGASTVQDLEIDGCINAGGTNIGGLAAELNGAAVTLQNIDTASNFAIGTAGSSYIGFMIGKVSENTPTSLTIDKECLIRGNATVKKASAYVGMIGYVEDKNVAVTTDDITLAATIDYNAAGGGSIGGLVGMASSGASDRTFELNNININGMTVNTANSKGGITSPAGALLGGKWYDTTVIFKDSSHTANTDKGVTVTSGSLVLTGTGNTYAGGLVAEATGYWQVNDVDIDGMSIIGASSALGLLVMRGKDGTKGLYLELTSPTAYSINSSGLTLPGSVAVFDEIMAYSKSVDTSTVNSTTVYTPSEENGQAIISIRTSNVDGKPKLSMGTHQYSPVTPTFSYAQVTPVGNENPSESGWYERSGEEGSYEYNASSDTAVDAEKTYYSKTYTQNPSTIGWYELSGSNYDLSADTSVNPLKTYYEVSTDNSYQPQTTLGNQHNPFSRYYYNLDYLLTNASTGGEKLLLWSVNKYAASNIATNTQISSARTYDFSQYSSFPNEASLDLSYLSYYPVDVSDNSLSITGKTITFKNYEMQTAHGGTYSLNALDASDNISQHYLMHAGLFKNNTKNLSLSSITLRGTVSAHAGSATVDAGSGAIICGRIVGSSSNSKASLTINGLTLNGIRVNGTSDVDALIVKKIQGNTNISLSNVTTTIQYVTDETLYAAKYLMGDAEGAAMTIVFDKMILDGRTSSSSLYNPSAESGTTADDLNQAYKTNQSIFSQATFLRSLKYTTGSGSSAKYDYKWNEDWGSTKHQVTYGKEVSDTSEYKDENNLSKQSKYVDRYNNVYTSPERNDITSEAYDFSNFIPHVFTAYNSTTNYHEVAVNIVSDVLDKGCGTYNDPYIVNGAQLKVIADILSNTDTNGGITSGFYLNIDNDYISSKNINFEKNCENKSGHTKFTYTSGNSLSGTLNGTNKSLDVQYVKDYLAGAYYFIESSTTLPSDYPGLGGALSRVAFRGVIVGADGVEIENQSDMPLINISNGCVVKNLTIKVTNNSITKSASSTETFDYDKNNTQYYGGVIGKIMAGDNIIDKVKVHYSHPITVSGDYKQNVPVGGYIGVVVNGSVFFRNMENINASNNTVSINGVSDAGMYFRVMDSDGNGNLQDEVVIDPSTGTETFYSLYVNPIIGRVINGFAVNETDIYRFSEDGKYVDYSSTGSGNSLVEYRTRGTSSDQVTLKNNRKNFSIPDFNPTSKLTFSASNGTYDTITANDAQALYILSLICQTQMGSAATDDSGDYTAGNGYAYNNNTKYRATHLAKYDGVGKIESVSNPGSEPVQSNDESDEDYALRLAEWEIAVNKYQQQVRYAEDLSEAKKDKANDKKQVPYLIYKYTNSYTNSNNNTCYPARTVTNSSRSWNLNLKSLGENENPVPYYLPDSFRGIGSVSSNAVYLTIRNFNGNGNTIDVNTYFRAYASDADNYHTSAQTGIALFNTLKTDGVSATNGIPDSNSTVIGNFTLTGYISGKRSDGTKTAVGMASPTNFSDICVGGFAPKTDSTYNIANIAFNNLNIDSSTNAGALFAKTSNAVYVNNCNADKLKVTGHRELGGMIGYVNGNLYINTAANSSSQFKINVHQLNAGNNNPYTGGIVGQNNNKTIVIKNVDVIGWNGQFGASSIKPYIGRSDGEKINDDKLWVGGAVGNAINGSKMIFDNIQIYGVNLYGFYAGGIIGVDGDNASLYSITNCGLHGKSNNNVTIEDTDTYQIKSQHASGGMVGRCYINNIADSFTLCNLTYRSQFNGCNVHDYQIEEMGYRADGSGAGGIIGVSRNNKSIKNVKVENCTLISNGSSNQCGMGGIIGIVTKHHIYAYNVVVKDLTYQVNQTVSKQTYSIATYGLFASRRGEPVSNNDSPKTFYVVGFSSQGSNKISVAFGNGVIPAGERDVEFDVGKESTSSNIMSNRISDCVGSTYENEVSYIIYSDYEGACENNNSTAGYRGTLPSTVNGTNAPTVSSTDNMPYVNSSPSVTLGDKTLTGDGIWVSKTGDTINLKADKIISDFNTNLPATGTKTYKAKTYANITQADITLYNALKTKISTYNTELGSDVLPTDIPVIVMDNPNGFTVDGTTYKWTDAIYAYIRILSNSTESFTASSSDIYAIDLKKCTYSSNNGILNVADSTTLNRDTAGNITMSKNDYDSNVSGQFTLIDVQFKNPAATSQVAYHLFIPVYTKKLFDFKFDITALSGTLYLPEKYTSGRHFGNLETYRGSDGENIVVDNYGSPVTMYLRYEYDITKIINNILGDGYGLDWNYDKPLNIVYNYTTNNNKKLPDNTKFILVDVNKQDKVNYSSSNFTPIANEGITIDENLFPAYSFTEGSGTKYKAVTFAELLQNAGIRLSATSITKDQAENSLSAVFKAVDDNSEEFTATDSSNTSNTIKLIHASQADINTGMNLYTVSAVKNGLAFTGPVYEDYYLTMISEKGNADVRHQLTFTSQSIIDYTDRIKAHCEANDEVVIMLADIFDKSSKDTVTTYIDEGSTSLMGGTNGKSYIDVQTVSTIKFALQDAQLNELISALDDRNVSIYANTHLLLKKTDSSGTKTVAVDDTSYTLQGASSEAATDYIYNNGIYVKLPNYDPQETPESDIFMSYDSSGNITGYYRQMNSCETGDLSGERVVNFYELQYTNNGTAIDLRPYLTGENESLTSNTAYEVVIVSNFRMGFTDAGIEDQFPIRTAGTEGTFVNAQTAIAYSPDQTKYSDMKTTLGTDVNSILYYTNPTSGAKLAYNVLSDEMLASGNLLAKTNDSLGINTWDEDTTTRSSLKTWAKYDITNYPDKGTSSNNQIQWTLTLRRREPVNNGGEYGTDLPIGTYLENVRFYDNNGIANANLVTNQNTEENATSYVYTASESRFVDLNNPNIYNAYVTYDVITGSDLESVNAFYSNYKVILTAKISTKGTSEASDFIVYTNAKLNPAYLE